MKIKSIKVKNYKNLVDMECEFPDTNVIGFIGNNGAGKSNVLELISLMFSYAKMLSSKKNIISSLDVDFCEIKYGKNAKEYLLHYSNQNGLYILDAQGNKYNKNDIPQCLPKSIFLYYSGETKRLANIANSTIDEDYDYALKTDNFTGYKFIEYFNTKDLDILLLVALYNNNISKSIEPYLNGKNITPFFNFIIKDRSGKKKSGGDEYYGATGFVKSIFDKFRKYVSRTEDRNEFYKMIFNGIEGLEGIKSMGYSATELFSILKALKNSGYLDRVIINFAIDNNYKKVVLLDDISEGEKQILLLLLITSITKDDDCLYLFDEFDSYMHLSWQKEFSHLLTDLNVKGQILFTTHSPATISGLHKDSVFILKDGNIFNPISDTYNRSLDEIIEEHLNVKLRREDFIELQDKFRDAVEIKDTTNAKIILQQLQKILSEEDPYLIAANNVIQRMEYYEAHYKK